MFCAMIVFTPYEMRLSGTMNTIMSKGLMHDTATCNVYVFLSFGHMGQQFNPHLARTHLPNNVLRTEPCKIQMLLIAAMLSSRLGSVSGEFKLTYGMSERDVQT